MVPSADGRGGVGPGACADAGAGPGSDAEDAARARAGRGGGGGRGGGAGGGGKRWPHRSSRRGTGDSMGAGRAALGPSRGARRTVLRERFVSVTSISRGGAAW